MTRERTHYTEIVDANGVHGAYVLRDIEELWRRIAFSIRINNVDDRLYNLGFLYVGQGRWRLSPTFDINPFPYQVRELRTWISAKTGQAMHHGGAALDGPVLPHQCRTRGGDH